MTNVPESPGEGNADNRRRVAIVEFDPRFIADLLLHGVDKPHYRLVPDHDWADLEILAVRESPPWTRRIQMLCRSSAFEEVPDNETAPLIAVGMRTEYCGCTDECHSEVK